MTRRSSVRAQARRNYRDLAAKAAPQKATPTPSPSPQGRGEKKEGGGEKKETKLTECVRALYEDSAVPVREIAALAGVTERTLYKALQIRRET
jgi:DNA invertase Pin-like site-specific DNA recombinase